MYSFEACISGSMLAYWSVVNFTASVRPTSLITRVSYVYKAWSWTLLWFKVHFSRGVLQTLNS